MTQTKHLPDSTKTRTQVVNVKPIKLADSLLSALELKRLLFAMKHLQVSEKPSDQAIQEKTTAKEAGHVKNINMKNRPENSPGVAFLLF